MGVSKDLAEPGDKGCCGPQAAEHGTLREASRKRDT